MVPEDHIDNSTALDSSWLPTKRLQPPLKRSALAMEMGMDPGDLSRLINSGLPKVRLLFEKLGIKCVDVNARCVRPETFEELTKIAGRALIEQPQLIWDDEP